MIVDDLRLSLELLFERPVVALRRQERQVSVEQLVVRELHVRRPGPPRRVWHIGDERTACCITVQVQLLFWNQLFLFYGIDIGLTRFCVLSLLGDMLAQAQVVLWLIDWVI